MATPENLPNEDLVINQGMDQERYWRVRGNLQKIMEFTGIRVEGAEQFSQLAEQDDDQGLILAPTHSSWLDIVALGAVNDVKQMRFMGKKELWNLPYIGKLVRDAGAFAVDRNDKDSRRSAVDASVQLVENGEWVVMYPEGTRNKSSDRRSIGKVKTGVARTALSAMDTTTILPIGIGYQQGTIRRKSGLFNMGLVVGDPIAVDYGDTNSDNVLSVTEELKYNLLRCKQRAVDLAES